MRTNKRTSERGGALVFATTSVVTVSLVAATLLGAALVESERRAERLRRHRAEEALGVAMGAAMARIHAGGAIPARLSGTVVGGAEDGVRWAVNVKRKGEYLKVSAAAGRLLPASGGTRVVLATRQAIVEELSALPPVPAGIGGAVTSYSGLEMFANLSIDGNNHDLDGQLVTEGEAGARGSSYGIATAATGAGAVTFQGNPTLAGNDEAGVRAVTAANATLGFGTCPNSPARALDMAADALAERTRIFGDEASAAAWVSGAGATLPNDQAIHLAFGPSQSFIQALDAKLDAARAYVLVIHAPSGGSDPESASAAPNGTAVGGNLHLHMKGILILDDMTHINGGSSITGAVVSLWGGGFQKKWGQGGAEVKYSTEAIGTALRDALGRSASTSGAALRHVMDGPPPDPDVYAAIEACGIGTAGLPPADPATALGWEDPQ